MFLGGYFGSRLMMSIRERGGYTYGIRASLNYHKNCSYLCIRSSIKKGCSDKVIEEIKKEINILRTELVQSNELESFKQFFIGEMISSISSPFVPISQYQTIKVLNLESNFYSKLAKTFITITSQQIMDISNKYLNAENFSSVIIK